MIRQKFRQEEFGKEGLPWPEDLLTTQAKNTMMHLSSQNLRLTSKNGKTPGRHLSATLGGEEEVAVMVGRLTLGSSMLPTPWDSSLQVRSRCILPGSSPEMEREGKNLPLRQALKLAPLALPRDVQEAQKQKMKAIGLEAKAAVKLDHPVGDEHCPWKVKACGVRGEQQTGLGKGQCKGQTASVSVQAPRPSPLPLTEASSRVKRQHKVLRAQLARTDQIQRQTGDRLSEDAGTSVSKGAPPPPLSSKPAPPFLSTNTKAQTQQAGAHGVENGCQAAGTFQQETGRRRLRLKRAERLEEDHIKSDMSIGGLPEKAKPTQHSHGVWQSRTLRGEKSEKCMRAEKALKEASRMLEKASKKTARPETPENLLEGPCKAVRGMAGNNPQEVTI